MDNISLLGYGLTTRAIARKLGSDRSRFYDDKVARPYVDSDGNTIYPSEMFDPDSSDMEILTPSIRPAHPLLAKAQNPISEYDYFLGRDGCLPTKPLSIWISGTNGKTTTTQMLTHLLESRGAVAGGNIGTPLADLDPDAPIWVLETSSYTLHHTHTASPDIYILLPITPDHLDWHGSAEAYSADKLRPLLTMREGELALIPSGLNVPQSDAWIVEYDSIDTLAGIFGIDADKIRFKAAFLQDAMLALSVTKTLFDQVDYDLINAFAIDKHRQQEIRDSRGRLWVNDSKATNVDATIQAIQAYADKHIALIIGGDDKGVDMAPLLDLIATKDISIYAIGSNTHKLIDLARSRHIKSCKCQTLSKAIETIYPSLDPDTVVLLSPAASSLDQFASYAARGDMFVEMVMGFSSTSD